MNDSLIFFIRTNKEIKATYLQKWTVPGSFHISLSALVSKLLTPNQVMNFFGDRFSKIYLSSACFLVATLKIFNAKSLWYHHFLRSVPEYPTRQFLFERFKRVSCQTQIYVDYQATSWSLLVWSVRISQIRFRSWPSHNYGFSNQAFD